MLKLPQFFLKFRKHFSFQSNYGWNYFVFWRKFVPWTVLPGTPYTCLTSLLQKAGMVKIWLQWNWPFCGTFFHSPLSKSPIICADSEWMTWCPTKINSIAVRQFFDHSCCGGRLKTELKFGVSNDFCDFHFFYFVTRVFNRLLIVMNNYWKGQIHLFFTFNCVEEVFS